MNRLANGRTAGIACRLSALPALAALATAGCMYGDTDSLDDLVGSGLGVSGPVVVATRAQQPQVVDELLGPGIDDRLLNLQLRVKGLKIPVGPATAARGETPAVISAELMLHTVVSDDPEAATGPRLFITAGLFDEVTGANYYSRSYRGDPADLEQARRQIARIVGEALRLTASHTRSGAGGPPLLIQIDHNAAS